MTALSDAFAVAGINTAAASFAAACRARHDELPPLLLTAGIAFLVGFRLAGWMGKRQIDRLKRVWSDRDSARGGGA